MAQKWHTTEVKSYELEDKLNSLTVRGYTIFSIHQVSGGFVDRFMVVYHGSN